MNHFVHDISIAVVFVVLAALFLDPFMLLMPMPVVYMLVAALLALFALFAGLVWRERALDEREQLHKMVAGRLGYLLGVGVLVLAIVVETFVSHPDSWLVAALSAMVLGKLIGLLYSRSRL